MRSPGWGNFCAFHWNDLPVSREFDGKYLENVKTPPHAPLPCCSRLSIDWFTLLAMEKNPDHFLDFVSTEDKSIHLVFQAELR